MDWHIALGVFGCLLAILLMSPVEDALWGAAVALVALLATMLSEAVRSPVRSRRVPRRSH